MTAPPEPSRDAREPGATSAAPPRADSPRDRTRDIEDAWRRERPDLDPASVRVVTRVWHLAALFSADRRRLLDARGLDSALLDLLGTLRRAGSPYALSTRELAERSRVTPAAISQRLTRAERRGWVTREPAGRRVVVHLTATGRETIDDAAGAIFDRERDLLTALPEDDRETLAALLERLVLDLERRGG